MTPMIIIAERYHLLVGSIWWKTQSASTSLEARILLEYLPVFWVLSSEPVCNIYIAIYFWRSDWAAIGGEFTYYFWYINGKIIYEWLKRNGFVWIYAYGDFFGNLEHMLIVKFFPMKSILKSTLIDWLSLIENGMSKNSS